MSDLFGHTPDEPVRKWVPAIYLQDESVPPPRATPQDWIVSNAGDFAIAADQDGNDPMPIAAGEAVEFHWFVNLGYDVLTIGSEGTWSTMSPEPAPPDGAALYVWEPGDSDTVQRSIDDFAQDEIDNGQRTTREIRIGYYAWSVAPVRLYLTGGMLVGAEAAQ